MKTVISHISLILFIVHCSICISPVVAQINKNFIGHLGRNQLQTEHQYYLFQTPLVQNDTLNYYKALYYLTYPNDSLFLTHVQTAGQLAFEDSCLLFTASINFLYNWKTKQENWFRLLQEKKDLPKSIQLLQQTFKAAQDPLNTKPLALPDNLRYDFSRYQKVCAKKPLLAAGLSALVPGLGQLYIGKKKSFVFTFFSQLIVAAQSYESVKHLGYKNAFSIINLGVWSVFYLSTIYGSYADTYKIRNELKQQYLKHASEYYPAAAPCTLY